MLRNQPRHTNLWVSSESGKAPSLWNKAAFFMVAVQAWPSTSWHDAGGRSSPLETRRFEGDHFRQIKTRKVGGSGGLLAEVVPGSAQTHDGAPVNGEAEKGSGAGLDQFRQPSFGWREWGVGWIASC